MTGPVDWDGVRERVTALARADGARRVFGAWQTYGSGGHGFRLAAPLPERDVSEAEAQWGVVLPAGYRAFLREVGAGGAGPGYGLSVLGRGAAGWRWSDVGGDMRHERLRFPCPGAEDSVRAQAEHDGREPMASGFVDDDAFDRAHRAWLAEDEALSGRLTSGALCLSHEGCGYCHWLVVTGPDRGGMRIDERPADGAFGPLDGVGFGDWYLDWLEKSEAVARRDRRDRRGQV
ncbi:SMI1/KNR4 family protein [Streptomyces sp. NPDC059477]|uniref:SMI1/KNR4 family protein n=1 Tax=Streptomyces sp. NPDC059477 TaxID=3346847 RepID=UPI0036C8298C